MNEFVEQFLIEGRELVQQATSDLLALERDPADAARLDGAFRAFHTLKGAAGIVDFGAMERALHTVEDTLAAVRTGTKRVTPSLVTHCLQSLDQVSAWLAAMEAGEATPSNAEAEADRIVVLFAGDARQTPPRAPPGDGATERARDLLEAQVSLVVQGGEGAEGRLASALRVGEAVLRSVGRIAEADGVAAARGEGRDIAAAAAALQRGLDALKAKRSKPLSPPSVDERAEGAVRALRIDVARIDALVKLTGELTTTKNAIGHIAGLAANGANLAEVAALLREHYGALDRLVAELQRSVLNVRVLPMRHVFERFPRLVREMSVELAKPAQLIIEGEGTEADKAIVEALFEPLLHVIRNSIDHGVEDAAKRAAAGKPAIASIIVRARRVGEHVVVEVEDDGKGVDLTAVRRIARERGVATPEAVAGLTDEEAIELIFAPGFTTSAAVTAISGRGVGMDAVRSAIQGMGGQVAIENRPGRGALVRFLLPFTLIMTRVLTVRVGSQTFGLPFDAIIETVRAARMDIVPIGAGRAFVHRDETLPVIDMTATLLGAPPQRTAAEAILVIAEIEGGRVAFEVDQIGGMVEAMLTPLNGVLAGVGGVAGVTLLGDGSVLIVLDPQQLSR